MNRLYLIDKPLELTSFFILKILKKKLDTPKAWHAGTLDPLATWLLLVATWNYTKLLPYLEDTSKEYEFTVMLDGRSPSHDLWTEVTKISQQNFWEYQKTLSLEKIDSILKETFTWEIDQVPPKYSAVKIAGQQAFKRIRNGEEITIKSKKVIIHRIEILSYTYPELKLRASVSSGTYVRSIASDLGEILGCGGYVTALRRTKIGALTLQSSQEIDSFDENIILSVDSVLPKNCYIELNANCRRRLDEWLEVRTELSLKPDTLYFVLTEGEISHIVRFDGKDIRPLRKI